MKTTHQFFFQNSNRLDQIPSGSVDLVVTSPPYPMIEMWDDIFSKQNRSIEQAIKKQEGSTAFELMHTSLDKVWDEVFRVLKNSGFACINIGDATRTLKSNFAIYPNHARILQYLLEIGFTALPAIIWRKQTNAPNKFMGSGMLPAGAYVTLEHEYILIVRKGGKREFKTDLQKQNRRQSALFWEERNTFFSDIWFDVKGSRQKLTDTASRKRSGAFPFELAYRLITMYSVKGDQILDPFLGTGTTTGAAMAAARNSIGYEIDDQLYDAVIGIKDKITDLSNAHMENRLKNHINFVNDSITSGKPLKHKNIPYGFPVITNQEKELILNELTSINLTQKNSLQVDYNDHAQSSFCMDWATSDSEKKGSEPKKIKLHQSQNKKKDEQLELF